MNDETPEENDLRNDDSAEEHAESDFGALTGDPSDEVPEVEAVEIPDADPEPEVEQNDELELERGGFTVAGSDEQVSIVDESRAAENDIVDLDGNSDDEPIVLDREADESESEPGEMEDIEEEPEVAEVEEIQIDNAQIQSVVYQIRSEQNLMLGTIAGAIAALVGASIWAAITVATEFQIGWMAIGVGIMV